MIKGLKRFSEYFSGFEKSYVLIGGAASHILEDEAQLIPRATKDLDIILVVEALSDEFIEKWLRCKTLCLDSIFLSARQRRKKTAMALAYPR